MIKSTKPISRLRQRMLDDMAMRKLNPKTQKDYIRAVVQFARYLKRAPHTATSEDLRRYQLHLTNKRVSSGTINGAISGLKFFFGTTLDRPERARRLRYIYEPRKIPEILSIEEITRLIQAAGSLKYQAALSVAYGAGLRASEVIHLKVTDVDSGRMILRVEQGKGGRDRHAFATHLLEQHEDIRVIQVLLGHKKLESTAQYSHVASKRLREVKGPLEYLNL